MIKKQKGFRISIIFILINEFPPLTNTNQNAQNTKKNLAIINPYLVNLRLQLIIEIFYINLYLKLIVQSNF